MIRAFVDTNVLVSGLLSPSRNEALIVLAIRPGLVHRRLSTDILAEYGDMLARPKFGFPADEIAALLAMLRTRGELIVSPESPAASPDPADTKFVLCAMASQAEFIVTGNKRHFPDAPHGTAHVVNAGELLDRITVEL